MFLHSIHIIEDSSCLFDVHVSSGVRSLAAVELLTRARQALRQCENDVDAAIKMLAPLRSMSTAEFARQQRQLEKSKSSAASTAASSRQVVLLLLKITQYSVPSAVANVLSPSFCCGCCSSNK